MPEYKAAPQFTKEISDRTVTGIFAVHGNIDSGGDRSWPGSFSNVAVNGRNRAKFLWSHQSDEPPIAMIKAIRELSATELPPQVLAYAPEATGGVEVVREYLDTPRGNEVLTGLQAGAIDEMSYAYDLVKYDFEEIDGRQVRNMREVKLFDVSDVIHGMNPATSAVKSWTGESLTFIEHLEAMVTAADKFSERAKSRADFRQKEGRVLSTAVRSRITSLLDSLKAVGTDLEGLLKETEPKADPATVKALYIQFLKTQSELNGVITNAYQV
jgi:HK97 family phage prohead protease